MTVKELAHALETADENAIFYTVYKGIVFNMDMTVGFVRRAIADTDGDTILHTDLHGGTSSITNVIYTPTKVTVVFSYEATN